VLVDVGHRLTFETAFAYANTRLPVEGDEPAKPGTNVILANADIYFDTSLVSGIQ
jgi:hypothetical protein